MDIEIKALSSALIPDYLDFFDNRAFADGNPNGPCYCNTPIMDAASIRQMAGEFGDDCKGVLRRYAVQQLAEGKIHGYLAFDGGKAVGWCNAGDMDIYAVNDFQFIPDFARQSTCGRTVSVVCFAIAPEYCGRGVASALLKRVVTDAAAAGYDAVEGYAQTRKERWRYDFKGPVHLFQKAGFREAARRNDQVVMRKV